MPSDYCLPAAREGFGWQLITFTASKPQVILPQLRASTGGCLVDIFNWTEATVAMVLTAADRVCMLGAFPMDPEALRELLVPCRRQATGILKEWMPTLDWKSGWESEPITDQAHLTQVVLRLQSARQAEDWIWNSKLLKTVQA